MASPPSSPPDSSPVGPPQALPLALPAPPPQTQVASQPQPPPHPPPPSQQPSTTTAIATTTTPATTTSRRLPPPCWSHDETVALIDSYRDKWYSLRRGNLKATHWQEVADAVSRRCPNASPAKTAVQCRHKMEKLRKRYRTEIQRARSMPVSRFVTSWVHFSRMDSMEKGPKAAKPENSDSAGDDDDDNEEDVDHDQVLYEELKYGSGSRGMNRLYRNGIGVSGGMGSNSNSSGGFRIRIPTGVSIAQPGTKNYAKAVDSKFGMMNQNANSNNNNISSNSNSNCFPNFGMATKVVRDSSSAKPGLGKRERDPVSEMVNAIKVLGDGFVRMEQMKMEMAREIETMRMEMEMKRTEMILESQQRIVEAFAKAVSEKKKTKRMPSPES